MNSLTPALVAISQPVASLAPQAIAFSPLCFLHALLLLSYIPTSGFQPLRDALHLPTTVDAAAALLATIVNDPAVHAAAAVFLRDLTLAPPPAAAALLASLKPLVDGSEVNKFVSEATRGMITHVIDPPLSPKDRSVLVSALYFKGEWERPMQVIPDPITFTGLNSEQKVQFMRAMAPAGATYAAMPGYTALSLPYKGSKVRAVWLLPRKTGAEALTEVMTEALAKPEEVIGGLKRVQAKVVATLPRFRVEAQLDGVKQVVEPAGLGNAVMKQDFVIGDEHMMVDDILHKVVIDCDEVGTTAAAVTVVRMRATAVSFEEYIYFNVDRPFVFCLAHESTMLFCGSIVRVR